MELNRWSWVVGFAGCVALVLGSAVYQLLGTWNGPSLYLWVFGGVSCLGYLALERRKIQEAASTPAFAFSGTSLLLQAVVALIVIVLFALAERSDTTFDLTTNRQHTLSDHARTVVSSLEEPVHVLAFFRDGTPNEVAFRRRIQLFEEASNGQLTVEWIDPLSNPLKAELHNIEGENGVAVITQGERVQRLEIDFDREEAFTKKLIVVQSEKDHRICWAIGHGEADPDDEYSADGLGAIVIRLEGFNYQVTKSLIATEGIDRACEALVIARPTVEWLPYEKEALAAYIAEGGAALILLDSQQVATSPTTSEFEFSVPNFAADLERFGFMVGNDLVLDVDVRSTMMGVEDPSMVVIHGQGIVHHQLTQPLTAAVNLFLARSVTPMEGPEGIVVQSILRTSTQAWAETDPNSVLEPNEGFELVGEVSVGAVAEIANPDVLKVAPHQPIEAEGIPTPEDLVLDAGIGRAVPPDFAPKPGGRVVVIGDSNFADNTLMTRGNNTDLFLNAIAWMVAEDQQLGERPNVGQALEVSGLGAGILCLVSLGAVPGMAILFAVGTLMRRRFL